MTEQLNTLDIEVTDASFPRLYPLAFIDSVLSNSEVDPARSILESRKKG